MALTGSLGTFHHPGVSRIDYKPLDMDRVLTALLARLWHQGMPSKISRTALLDVDVFVKLFLEHPEVFDGFDRETTTRWTVTHLMDMVNRGRADEAVAAPRPLHGFTYRFRNSRKSRPYGADEQLYEMLCADEGALKGLREFFFSDVDRATGAISPGPDTDVETQALLHLVELAGGRMRDQADTSKPRTPYPPLCAEPAQLLCQDVMRLLYHQDHMPRTVLVDYLKTLFAFHLALYHLRMMKLLPAAVTTGTVPEACRKGHRSQAAADRCPYQVRLFLDADGTPGTAPAALAEHSTDIWYRRIPRFVQATYQVKKLDDFAESLAKAGTLSRPAGRNYFTPEEALRLLDKKRRKDRDAFFLQRVTRVRDEEEDLPPELKQIIQLGLDPFDEYTEMLMHYRGRYYRSQFVKCLDSMLLKHRPGALLAQPRGGGADSARRFILDGRLLEVLLQVSLLRESADGSGDLATAPMRVDAFLSLLRSRYGLYIDRLPDGDGFAGAHLDDQAALRANSAAFLNRLREIGYYQDMSDAYLTQTITPRYAIGTAARMGGQHPMTSTPTGTTGLAEATAKDLREALEGVLVPQLAKLIGERSAGHCMRVTEADPELAASLVRRLRGALGPDTTVCLLCPAEDLAPDGPLHDVGVSSTKLVELRNRSEGEGVLPGPLLVFVPPGIRVSAEDSFGIATFEEVPLGDAYAHLTDHLLDQVPQQLRPAVDELLAAVRTRPDGRRASDRAVAQYLLTLQVNGYRDQVAGAAVYHFGLVPDFDLFTDPAQVRDRVGKNHSLVQKLTDSPRSERQRVLDLGLSDNDFATRLAAFATRCGLEEPKTWTRRIVVDRENWGLSFGNWRIDERHRATVSIDVRELGLPSAGDNTQHLADYPALASMAGQPYLLTGEKGVRDITVRFAVRPDPRKVEGLERFRVEIVSENGGPIGRAAYVGKGKTAKPEYKKALNRLNKIDWEEGWHYIRVVPLDAEDEPLHVAAGAHDLPGGESERFYVVPDAETEEPPERSAGRFPGLTQALRSLQLDALAAGEDPAQVTATDIRWKAFSARSPHRTLSAKIHAAGSGEIRLSPLLVQAQQHLLAHPDDTSLRRLLLHPDGTAQLPDGDDVDLGRALSSRAAEAYDTFVAARRDYFTAITGEMAGSVEPAELLVSEAVDFEQVRDELAAYAEAYAELVDAAALQIERATDTTRGGALEALARVQQIDCVAATLTDGTGRHDTVLLVAPTHPLRALWLATWSALGLDWTSRLISGDKKAVLPVRDSLLASLAPLGFPFAIPRQDGRLMAAADNLTPYWGAYLPSETADPRGVIGRLTTALNLPPENNRATTNGSGALSGTALADRIERYVRLHPYVSTLVMNVVNAGRAEIVADTLLELQRRTATRELTYDIRLCVIDPEAPETGAALMELQSAQSQISSAEAEAFLHTAGPARVAKLVHSVRSVYEFTRQPTEFDAHLTILIDAFGGEQHASTARQDITHAPVHGLVQATASAYEDSDQQIVWRTAPRHGTALAIEDAEDLTTLMGRLPALLATAAACVATAGQALRNVPCTVLSLDTDARDLLYQAHQSGDWVVTIDRTLGLEYFDNAGRHGRPEYVIDYAPAQGSGLGHQIMVSSNSVDELRTLLRPTAEQHGLTVEERHLNTFFDQLRLLSGNLAFKLASTAPNQRTEVLGLSLARLYLDYQDVLHNQIVVPLDAHPELYAEARRQARELGDVLSFQRSDLALFQLDAQQRTITCRLVEVKCYTALDDVGAYQRLKTKVAQQLERSQTVLAESFDPNLTTPDRVDRPVKNLALASMLRFYLERAARHGTLNQTTRTAAHQLLDSLDDGYQLRFTQSGLIFDLARTGTDQETDGEVEFHRIGQDLVTELVEAIPTVRPGVPDLRDDAEPVMNDEDTPTPDGAATAPTLALLPLSIPRLAEAAFRADDAVVAQPERAVPEEVPESHAEEASAAPQPAPNQPGSEEGRSDLPPPPVATDPTPSDTPSPGTTARGPRSVHDTPTVDAPSPATPPPGPTAPGTKPDIYLGVTRPSPQHGVLGEVAGRTVSLDLNETHTISLFGVQGGGKSYTLGSIIEAASLPAPPVNVLPHPLATVVFHYSKAQDYAPEFTSMVHPNDDNAQVAALKERYGAEPRALTDVLLLAPEAQVDERREQYPGIEVHPLAFSSAELKAEHWKFLLGAVGNRSTYIKQIAKAIRKHRNNLTLDTIRQELADSRMPDHIKDLAEDRLDLAAEYIDDNVRLTSLIRPGRLIIVDLRDDLIEKDDALGLFVVLMQLFADARDGDHRFNKLVVFDEAHKYIDSPDLVAGLVESVREMRHKGMSILVASQDPPSVPVQLIELSNHVILHKFTSPAWLKHLQKANSALSGLTAERLAQLRPGEAYIWSSKATDPAFTYGAVRIRCRPRVTQHGGDTKTASGE